MTPETILSLLCKLTDTIDAQQARIDQLEAEVARLSATTEGTPQWPDTPTSA